MNSGLDANIDLPCLMNEFKLKRLPIIPLITRDDPRLECYEQFGLDVDAILQWLNPSDSIFRRNRQQLLSSFPILLPVLVIRDIYESVRFDEVAVAVDRSDPLIESTAKCLNIDPTTIRYLMKLSPVGIGPFWTKNSVQLFWAIRIVPEACRPRTVDDWLLFHEYWRLSGLENARGFMSISSECSHSSFNKHLFKLLCRNGYSNKARQRVHKLTGGQPNKILHALDYCNFVSQWCLDHWESMGGAGKKPPALAESLLLRYPLGELIRQSIQWHQDIHADITECPEDTSSSGDGSRNSWPPLLQEPLIHSDLQAVSMVSTRDLAQEGLRMQHCVAHYELECLFGRNHIISIRHSSGISLSTVNIVLEADGPDRWRAICVEHSARENSTPSADCKQMRELLLEQLRLDESQAWFRELQQIHMWRREEVKHARMQALQDRMGLADEMLRRILPDFDQVMMLLGQQA